MTNKDKILLQNAKFYEAFENSDLVLLDEIWNHGADVKCIHPGGHLLQGWTTIRESWERILSSETNMRISLRNVSVEVHNTLGIVTLIEEISYTTATSIHTAGILATNIFALNGKEWKMIHHHGSPLMVAEEKERDYKFRFN